MNNEDRPLVSIITPTFNSAQFLPRTLKCIADQTYSNIEHIVVDGGSTDGTLELLKNQSKAKWVTGRDNGMYDAINKGLHLAQGSVLAYLNSDDLYFNDTVERVVNFLRNHPDADLLYSDLRYIDENEDELFSRKYPEFSWTLFAVLDGSTVPQQTCFWRRRVHDAVGYFDDTFRMAGDFEFLIRVGKSCKVQKLNGSPLAQFRFHGEMQTINQVKRNDEEIVRIHRMYGFQPSARNQIVKAFARLRYVITNLHRLADKFALLISGKKLKYRP